VERLGEVRISPRHAAASATEEGKRRSGEDGISPHQYGASFTTDFGVVATPSESLAAVLPSVYVSDSSSDGEPTDLGVIATASASPAAVLPFVYVSDSSSDGEPTDLGVVATPSASLASVLPSISDSSSDGESEKCPICLVTFAEQEVGTPDTCDHIFCVVCLREWSKIVSTCPVDRQVFNTILLRRYSDRQIMGSIAVTPPPRLNRYGMIIVHDVLYCLVCGQSDRLDRMTTCLGCGCLFHLECLNPPLDDIPSEEWFCPFCVSMTAVLYPY
jgi:hypothetical protein